MAVISCPSCRKKISDRSQSCSHCGLEIGSLDRDKLASIQRENSIKLQASLMNHSFIAMLLFCGGFLFLYWKDAQPGSWEYTASMTSTVIGFILYIITRVRIVLVKRKLK